MSLSITYLGHSGFLLADGEHTLAVDPFLTGNPVAVHKPADIHCDFVALTHGHADHVGDTVAIAQANGATLIAVYELAVYLNGEGVRNCEQGNPGGRIATDFGSVAFTQAFHSSSYEGRYMGQPAGLIIEMGGKTVYHAGDTGLFSDMKLIGELYRPHVAILPIGDRFTMGPDLATRAAEWVGAPVMVPCHYNTWPPIAQNPATMKPKGVTVRAMKPGERWQVA